MEAEKECAFAGMIEGITKAAGLLPPLEKFVREMKNAIEHTFQNETDHFLERFLIYVSYFTGKNSAQNLPEFCEGTEPDTKRRNELILQQQKIYAKRMMRWLDIPTDTMND